ncbi:hypothetical protein [Enterobacter ludwigii]|uniref:hypothetical protein n=1 Tax=Enterobacter ludwigii TaxID=299767 RepID=UPI003D751DB0
MKSFTISLRAWHPTLSAEAISSKMGLPAAHAYSAGHERVTPKGTPLDGVYRESYCSFEIMGKTTGYFTDGITQCAQMLKSLAAPFSELTATGGRLEVYVWIYPEGETDLGFELERPLIRLLSDLNLTLSVEIYV